MTTEQRLLDFQGLAALYAKRYAPYEWKKQAFGVDLFNIKPYLDRVRAAKDDLEFFEIQAEYVASFQDTHSLFQTPSNFGASLGITLDIYDGKVLIDSISRARLPLADYPFVVGDELVSLDGVAAADLIEQLSKYRKYGNPQGTRRYAAGAIASRSQSIFPRTVELGDSAVAVIRSAGGGEKSYRIPWVKSGYPLYVVGPVPMPKSKGRELAAASEEPSYLKMLAEMHNYKLPDDDPTLQPVGWGEDTDPGVPRKFIIGSGSRAPIFEAGLPSTFVRRLGRFSSDINYSGTYKSGDLTIGYLRIPSFSPLSQAQAIREVETEVTYFQANTDGLVVDVMRNPGGSCYMIDVAARLIPFPFYFFGERLRATQDRLNSFQSQLELARATRAADWVIATYQSFVQQTEEALRANRGLTDSIAACSQYGSDWAPVRDGNPPAAIVYRKPLIILIDEFSVSAADIFPSMMQDNGRGVLVGMRTSGGGGSVGSWATGLYSESTARNTNSLVVRKTDIVTKDLPAAPYVENIGARPDIELDYMTRENLMNNGKPFVEAFTGIMVDQIRKAK